MAFGLAFKSLSFFLRIIQFLCAAIILGIFSYFLSVLVDHHLHVDTYVRAVEGISGAGVVYTIVALLLVCCLGGIAFFSFIGILLDIAFAGAFAYIAYATRHGAHSCTGIVNTPLGIGSSNNEVDDGNGGVTLLPSLHTACRLNTACFAVSIIAAVFFLLSVPVELLMMRHRKREKAFGPSPNNGYTAGTPRRKFWQRKPKTTSALYNKENPDALPTHTTPAAMRDSYATEETHVGSHAGEPVFDKYGNTAAPQQTGYATTTQTYQPYAGGAAQNHNTTGTF